MIHPAPVIRKNMDFGAGDVFVKIKYYLCGIEKIL